MRIGTLVVFIFGTYYVRVRTVSAIEFHNLPAAPGEVLKLTLENQ